MPEPREPKPNSPGKEGTPSPDPSPGESPGAEGSSRASERGSQGPELGFLGNPGPAFDPGGEEAPEQPQEADLRALPALEPEWDEEALQRLLLAKGELLHTFAGVAENDWRYTAADLKAIAPPLSRILNRYPATRAVSTAQDPLALAIGVSAYAIRSGRERGAVLRELAEEPEEPITGVPAPPGAGPPEPETPINADVDPETEPAAVEWQT